MTSWKYHTQINNKHYRINVLFHSAHHQQRLFINNVLGVKPDPAGACLWVIIEIRWLPACGNYCNDEILNYREQSELVIISRKIRQNRSLQTNNNKLTFNQCLWLFSFFTLISSLLTSSLLNFQYSNSHDWIAYKNGTDN